MPSVSSIKNATSSSEALKNASALPGEFERYFLNCTYCLTVYFLECNSLKIRSASASLDSYFPPTIDDNKSKTLPLATSLIMAVGYAVLQLSMVHLC